jgi:chromosome segregation ATPase
VDFLVKSHEANVAGLEGRLKEAESNRNDAKIEVRDIEARYSAIREEVGTLNNQRNKLQHKSDQLEKAIREAEDEQHLGTGDNFETLVREQNHSS